MNMPGRGWKGQEHRFGFNGKETDEESGLQDYGFRIYNPRIAKFLSVDPLAPDYPWYTPYQFAGNKPIWAVDLDGLEEYFSTSGERLGKYGGFTEIRVLNSSENAAFVKEVLNNQKGVHPGIFKEWLPAHSLEATTNRDQIALDFVFKYNGKTHIENIEYGVRIGLVEATRSDGKKLNLYRLGSVAEGRRDGAGDMVDLRESFIPKGWKLGGGVHTHTRGKDAEVFSGPDPNIPVFRDDNDKGWAKKNGVSLYLGTPDGYLKVYDPRTDAVRTIYDKAPTSQYGDFYYMSGKKRYDININDQDSDINFRPSKTGIRFKKGGGTKENEPINWPVPKIKDGSEPNYGNGGG